MKCFLMSLIFLSFNAFADAGVRGTVQSPKGCGERAMVWLSLDNDNYQERLLLMHTEVPVGGSFQFYLKPGNYQLRASDQKGCDYLKRITVKESVMPVAIQLVKR